MRTAVLCCCLIAGMTVAVAGEFVVEKVHGDVMVREGVQEAWRPVATADQLKPHDSMRTGKGASAVLRIIDGPPDTPARITVPGDVILDLSDIRTLTREELILKLTMERVKAAPYEWKSNDLQIPNATVVHGSDKTSTAETDQAALAAAELQMNGTRVLFDNGLFPTCALRGLSLLGRFPSLGESYDHRLLVAESLERSKLPGEALSEYTALASLPGLTPEQKTLVEAKIARIRESR